MTASFLLFLAVDILVLIMNVLGSTIVYLGVYVSMIKYILTFLCKRALSMQIDIPNNVLFALVEFKSFGVTVT